LITQKWLVKNNKYLLGVSHYPDSRIIKGAVLIFPGFSLPMCDVDYFTTKLARRLVKKEMYVLQLDPFGHGDSSGSLSEVTLESLRDDALTGLEYLQKIHKSNVFCVGRGLMANIFAEAAELPFIKGTIGINPVCIDPDVIKKLWEKTEVGVYECSKLLPGSEYSNLTDFSRDKLAFFEAIGARMRNIHGQYINTEIFKAMEDEGFMEVLKRCGKGLWFFTDGTCAKGYKTVTAGEIGCRTLDDYYKKAIVRNPLWQFNLIEDICESIMKRVED